MLKLCTLTPAFLLFFICVYNPQSFSFLFFWKLTLSGICILFLIYFICLFLAALGLRCCAWAFSSCGERGLLFVVVRRLLIAVASLVLEHALQARGLQ